MAVLGAGPIGLMTARVARISGAKKVIITDVDDFRLSMAKKLGVEPTINVKNEVFEDKVAEAFEMTETKSEKYLKVMLCME